jgi:membrane-associated HD superfamily phosphohydrolase
MDFIEDIMPFLVWIIIAGIGRLIKTSTEEANQNQQKGKSQKKTSPKTRVDNKKIETPLEINNSSISQQKDKIQEEIEKEYHSKISKKKERDSVKKKKIKDKKNKKKQDEIKDSKGFQVIDLDSVEESILRGIVFKEIIDKPRSKKPYKYHH